MASTTVNLTSPGAGTWIVPHGVYQIAVSLTGGGGGGGTGSNGVEATEGTPTQVIPYTLSDYASQNNVPLQTVEIVASLYNNILNRLPETAGLGYWTEQLVNGADPTTVVQNFINSAQSENNTADKQNIPNSPAVNPNSSGFTTAFNTGVADGGNFIDVPPTVIPGTAGNPGAPAYSGGGGGSGYILTKTLDVLPGSVITYYIGNGGAPNSQGEATTFGPFSTNGGNPGNGQSGGLGGVNGQDGIQGSGQTGGAGGSPNGGTGGSTGNTGSAGSAGSITIYPSEIRGVTYNKNSNGKWLPLRGLWTKNSANVWVEVTAGSIKRNDGTWEQIYPTPAGKNSPTPMSANLTVYQHYTTTQTINFTNTGDYGLTIANVIARDGATTTTSLDLTGINGGYPYTISPNGTGYITASVYGNSVGTSTGNVTFINETGFFGTDGNIAYWPGNQTVIPITTQVLPNYNGISVNPATIDYSFYQGSTPASTNVVITNSGNGANLHVNVITSGETVVSGISLPKTIGFDFNSYTGNTAQFTVTAPAYTAGVYSDTLKIYSDALNTQQSGGYITIPVNFTVLATHGNKIFATPGTYTWTVLPGIVSMQVAIIGGGGGGGGSTEVGNGGGGGGGGSGGVVILNINVVPGETITITVGSGGAGSPFVGRDAGAAGDEGAGQPGGDSFLVYNSIYYSVTGGQGGTQAYGAYSAYGQDGLNGFGGIGGLPGGAPGNNGTLGTDDYSSTYGGAGGNNGFVFINNGGQPNDQFQIETINTSDSSLYVATLYGTYNDFLNAYGVWTNADLVNPVGSWIDVNFYTTLYVSGTYTLTVSADNHIRVYIDGNFIGGNDDWGTTNSYSVSLTAGVHTILCQALNDGGPASFAAALTDPNGSVEWSTRSPLEYSPNPNNIYGRGGAGADAPDRVSPYNWAGNPGAPGAVILSW